MFTCVVSKKERRPFPGGAHCLDGLPARSQTNFLCKISCWTLGQTVFARLNSVDLIDLLLRYSSVD